MIPPVRHPRQPCRPGDDQPLLHAGNCQLTLLVVFLPVESMIRRAHIAFDNTMAYLDGHRPDSLMPVFRQNSNPANGIEYTSVELF